MLKDLVPRLACPACTDGGQLKSHAFVETSDGHIRDGVLVCSSCRAWYPIDDRLLELVTGALVDRPGLAAFSNRWRDRLQALGLQLSESKAIENLSDDPDVAAQLKQREHFDWYAANGQQSYLDYARTPFWTAVDDITFRRWRAQISPGAWLLDIGCANGRSAFPLAERGGTVVGFDISKKMIRQAIQRAERRGQEAQTTFLVADGSNPPFADHSFDYALTYGVLHHLPDPGATCRRIQQILKPGGIFFASENNKTVFRGIFDWMMKLLPLWTEEAGTEPLISREMIRDWHAGLPAEIHSATSVFLPPHLFNLVGQSAARALLKFSDTVASLIPGLCGQGGLIVFEVHKAANVDKSGNKSVGSSAADGKKSRSNHRRAA
jgi:ubiquinone/menaquinone biosynthesis C-methylase UbiE/uncharacterized protein YbaR (Trm112 family)